MCVCHHQTVARVITSPLECSRLYFQHPNGIKITITELSLNTNFSLIRFRTQVMTSLGGCVGCEVKFPVPLQYFRYPAIQNLAISFS
jgi:hypothetical protein